MNKVVWYISKYIAPPTQNSCGGRGYLLLNEMAENGIDVIAITSDSNNLTEVPALTKAVTFQKIDKVDFVWLKTIRYKVAKSAVRILSWLHFEWNLFWFDKNSIKKPDVVIVSSLSLLTIVNGFLLRRKFKCKLVFEIRDIWPLTLVEDGGFSPSNLFVRVLGFVERIGYKYSDLIVGTMPNLKGHVVEILKADKKVECIPMGVDPDSIALPTNLVSEEFFTKFVPKDKFIVMYAGTIGITNALETLFNCAEMLKENDQIHFVIVGSGALRDEFMAKYAHLKNLTFADKVNKKQVQSVLARADLLYFSVFPSKLWNYGQSLNKVIDYMLSGKPVLASYDGYPSMIDESGCGYFIPAGDSKILANKIVELKALGKEKLQAIGQSGREWLIKNRTYKKLAADYQKILFPAKDEVRK